MPDPPHKNQVLPLAERTENDNTPNMFILVLERLINNVHLEGKYFHLEIITRQINELSVDIEVVS